MREVLRNERKILINISEFLRKSHELCQLLHEDAHNGPGGCMIRSLYFDTEYDRSFLAARILFDKFNGSLIISGAFGLFKKETVIACGGYDHTTMGEDMELVVKLHEYCASNNLPYRIRYANNAICSTVRSA